MLECTGIHKEHPQELLKTHAQSCQSLHRIMHGSP